MKEAAKVYLARAGKNGEDEDYALENNVAIIGFEGIPSLESAKNYDTVATRVSDALPGRAPHAIGNIARQLTAFTLAMKEDDIVVLPRKLTLKAPASGGWGMCRRIGKFGICDTCLDQWPVAIGWTCLLGKDHHNPQCDQVGERHKHRWSERYGDKEASVPENVNAPVSDPVAVWNEFCAEARIQHDGIMKPPPPTQGELW